MKNLRRLQISYYINMFGAIVLLIFAVLALSEEKLRFLLIVDLAIMGITLLTAMYFGIRCIVNALQLYKKEDLQLLREYMKVGKRGLIPFFIINFIYYILIFMLLIVASHGIFLFSPIPLLFVPLIIFTYFAVIFTSSFSIAFILLLKKKEKISIIDMVLNIWLQLIFILDIIGMILLLNRFNKNKLVHSVD